MTLDEHIKKAEEDAERAEFDTEWGIGNYFIDREDALEYAKECRQLAEWLKELKQKRQAIKEIKAEIEFIKKAEYQIYGKGSWNFVGKCLDVIDKHTSGARMVENN